MAQRVATLHELAVAALEGHGMMLRALEQEPARQRDANGDAEVSERWLRWFDEVLTPAWAARDKAITPLLAHPDWPRWHKTVWRDMHTAGFRTPYVWRPVAAAIVRDVPR